MFSNTELYDKLRSMKRPDDLIDTPILNDIPKTLKIQTSLTSEEKEYLTQANIYFMSKKISKKPGKNQNVWDVDITSTGPGHFDDAGNFILNRSKKINNSWLIKRDNIVEGPFTEREMKIMVETNKLEDVLIKRDFDKGFVDSNKLIKEIPEFYTGEEGLNKYFIDNQIIETKEKLDEFYSNVVTREKSTKLSNLIKKFNINANPDFIIKTITGIRKAEAIDAISGITGLDRMQNQNFIELLIEDSKTQILKDVDRDGFEIATFNKKKNYFRK